MLYKEHRRLLNQWNNTNASINSKNYRDSLVKFIKKRFTQNSGIKVSDIHKRNKNVGFLIICSQNK